MTESIKTSPSVKIKSASKYSPEPSIGKSTRLSKSSITLGKSDFTNAEILYPERDSNDSRATAGRSNRLPSSCECGPDLYTRILGPTADETILTGLQTFLELCNKIKLSSCGGLDSTIPERDSSLGDASDIPERDILSTSDRSGQTDAKSLRYSIKDDTDPHNVQTSKSQTDSNDVRTSKSQTDPNSVYASKSQTDSTNVFASNVQTDPNNVLTSKSQTDPYDTKVMTIQTDSKILSAPSQTEAYKVSSMISQTDARKVIASKSQTEPKSLISSKSQTMKNMVSAGFQVNPTVKTIEIQTSLYPEMVSEILQTIGLSPDTVSQIVQTSFTSADKFLLEPKKVSLASNFMQTSNPSLKSGFVQTSTSLIPTILPGVTPKAKEKELAFLDTFSEGTQSDSISTVTRSTGLDKKATIGDEHKCICPPEPPTTGKTCKCCSCSSTQLRRGGSDLSKTTSKSSHSKCVCYSKRKRGSSRSTMSLKSEKDAPTEVRYAVTRISKYKDFTTFEVMRSTSKVPKQMPTSIEGVFVMKKEKKDKKNGKTNGRENGKENGKTNSRENGKENGKTNGRENGKENGKTNGRENGKENGKSNGREHKISEKES